MSFNRPKNPTPAKPDAPATHPLSENWVKIIFIICGTILMGILIFLIVSPAIQKIIEEKSANELVVYIKNICIFAGGYIFRIAHSKIIK
jgi:hypothetical protein